MEDSCGANIKFRMLKVLKVKKSYQTQNHSTQLSHVQNNLMPAAVSDTLGGLYSTVEPEML